jgi:hypothetical protein
VSKVIDKDRGWKRIKRNLKVLDDSYTKVGLQQGTQRTAGGITSAKGSSYKMTDLVTVGAVHEFGAPKRNIPERSFIRSTFDKEKQGINKLTDKLRPLFYKDPRKALAALGEWMEAKIKSMITAINTPPNAPSTIARKGSSNPLIDTSQMRQSIRHVEVIR